MANTCEIMIRREARQTATGHTIILLGLFTTGGFVAPLFGLQFEEMLPGESFLPITQIAFGTVHFMRQKTIFVVPFILLFGYIDYRFCLLLRKRGMNLVVAIWSAVYTFFIAEIVLWFTWAIAIPHTIFWRIHHPDNRNCRYYGDVFYASLFLIVMFAIFIGSEILIQRREQKRCQGNENGQQDPSVGPSNIDRGKVNQHL